MKVYRSRFRWNPHKANLHDSGCPGKQPLLAQNYGLHCAPKHVQRIIIFLSIGSSQQVVGVTSTRKNDVVATPVGTRSVGLVVD